MIKLLYPLFQCRWFLIIKIIWKFPNGTESANRDENIFPMHIGAGTKVSIEKIHLNLYADYNYYNTSVEEKMKDRHNINAGAEYLYDKNLTLKAGFFTMPDNRNFNLTGIYWVDPEGKYAQYFITAGASYSFKNVILNLAYMDSRLLSSGSINQSLLNAGVGWNF
jgi:hypothetical protein